ncbi:MAG: hypothetical protein F4Z25_02005 [Chloroflexi bacterium]|nr:hypothetical protein [Chloroflexota bacterium]
MKRERGFRAAFWFALKGMSKRRAFKRPEEHLGDLVEDLDVVLDDVRWVRPGVLESCRVAIPCTCPSVTTLRGLTRAARALTKVMTTHFLLIADELGNATHSAAEKRRLERLAHASVDFHRVLLSLDWVEQSCERNDFARCDRCGADDTFRRLAEA